MKKENKIITLKLAKELKEIASINNFNLPESEWAWRVSKRLGTELVETKSFKTFDGKRIKLISEKGLYNGFFAFDTSELGEILRSRGRENMPHYVTGQKCWAYHAEPDHWIEAETEAEVRGLCLLYLIKNKLINL